MPLKIPVSLSPFLLVALCLSSTCYARTVSFPKDLSKWIVTAPPKSGSQRWYAANYSQTEWKVSLRNGKVAVGVFEEWDAYQNPAPLPFSPNETTRGRRYSTQVSDGWIIGFNGGEWGGSLWWYSPRGDKHYLISKDQVSGFFHTRVGLLALEGLAHMRLNDGQIIQLHKTPNGRWKSSRFVNLSHAPRTATQDTDGSLLVATTDRLLRVGLNRKIEVLLSEVFWRGLYPNSLVVAPSRTIYLGMRHGVTRIRQRFGRRKVEWLLPNRAFVNAKAEL